jgi:hypothetical protein
MSLSIRLPLHLPNDGVESLARVQHRYTMRRLSELFMGGRGFRRVAKKAEPGKGKGWEKRARLDERYFESCARRNHLSKRTRYMQEDFHNLGDRMQSAMIAVLHADGWKYSACGQWWERPDAEAP